MKHRDVAERLQYVRVAKLQLFFSYQTTMCAQRRGGMATVMNAGHNLRRVGISRMCVLDSTRLLATTGYDDFG